MFPCMISCRCNIKNSSCRSVFHIGFYWITKKCGYRYAGMKIWSNLTQVWDSRDTKLLRHARQDACNSEIRNSLLPQLWYEMTFRSENRTFIRYGWNGMAWGEKRWQRHAFYIGMVKISPSLSIPNFLWKMSLIHSWDILKETLRRFSLPWLVSALMIKKGMLFTGS